MVGADKADESFDGLSARAVFFEGSGAEGRAGEEDHLPDFAGGPRGAVVEASAEDEAAADAGSDPDTEEVGGVGACAESVFAEDGDIDIVVEEDGWSGEGVGEAVGEWDIVPAEVGGFEDDSGGDIDGARRADADAREVGGPGARGGAGFVDGLDDASDDGVSALLGLSEAFGAADDAVGGVDDADLHVRAAEIDSDDERAPGGHEGFSVALSDDCVRTGTIPRWEHWRIVGRG